MVLLERTISESSEDFDIRPLELGDLKRRRQSESDENDKKKQAEIDDPNKTKMFFSAVMGMKRKKGTTMNSPKKSEWAKQMWINSAKRALKRDDPWKNIKLDEIRTEKAKRHRYHAFKKYWVLDDVLVKMEAEPFGHGAMRECFRTKKLSNFTKSEDWSSGQINYVSKRYLTDVVRETYFDDVRLQIDAKLWGQEFNRHNPPKKVDIFQMAILELVERSGSPLYHVEHFIEGKYEKYNSNSGYVIHGSGRMTPQAFSHFTFERSGHELIVVDVQGCGDLYTDPQIHTSTGSDYGDGNLGTRGMALFFHSHVCNSICKIMKLHEFELFPTELRQDSGDKQATENNSKTMVRGTEEHVIMPSEEERENIQDIIRLRSISSGYLSGDEKERIDSISSIDSLDSFDDLGVVGPEDPVPDSGFDSARQLCRSSPRTRYDSTTDFGESTETKESAWKEFNELVKRKTRPSRIVDKEKHEEMVESLQQEGVTDRQPELFVLGQIHLDLAKYHELNRFVEADQNYDHEAALFHLEYAAKCGNLAAILAMAQIHSGLPHDILPDLELGEDCRKPSEGFRYLLRGANLGDRASMINVARAFDSGAGHLPENSGANWKEAIYWYDSAVRTEKVDCDGDFDGTMDDPIYQLVARQAQLYSLGGNRLEQDPNKAGELFTQAADLAMEAMKGKLASKYYMEAEEAWAQVEE